MRSARRGKKVATTPGLSRWRSRLAVRRQAERMKNRSTPAVPERRNYSPSVGTWRYSYAEALWRTLQKVDRLFR